MAACCAVGYVTFAVTQWRLLESPSWDLGIFTQLARAYAGFDTPIVTIKGEGFNLLGDHFHPLLVLLAPVYWIHPSGVSLLIAQAVLFAFSAVPVTTVARELLGPVQGTLVGVAYALSWGLQGAVAAQFHEIAFAVPLLAASLAAYLRRRWWTCALWAAPLVFIKEDLGLTVAALGLVLWLRAGQRRIGRLTVAWGVGWTALAIGVVLPLLHPDGTWDYYGRLAAGEEAADGPGDGAGGVLATVAAAFVPAEKYVTLLLLVGAAGVIGVRSPLVWLWVPTLAWRFLGNVEYYWGWTWHYSAVLMPVAVAALLDVVSGRTGTGHLGRRLVPARRWASAGTAAALLTTAIMTVTGPMNRLVEPETYAGSPRADVVDEMIDIVAGRTVEADIYLMAYLVPRSQVYWVGNEGNPPPDRLVLDATRRTWTDDVADAADLAEERHPGQDYELVLDEAGYQVAARVR